MVIYKSLDLLGFPNYEVGSDGKVFSKGVEIKQYLSKNGYLRVRLYNKGYKNFSVHRLVALSFISNPHNLKQVNHKNEDKTDNRVENLEWCDSKYNINYGTGKIRQSEATYKEISQYTLDNVYICSYGSNKEASKITGINKSSISLCCKGKRNKAGNYIWKYKNPEEL